VEALIDIVSLSLQALTEQVEAWGEKSFRAKQLYRWLHQRGATTFDEMTDLAKPFRQVLAQRAAITTLSKDLEQRSVDGTIKFQDRRRQADRISLHALGRA
jgi:23S rRNA (adenine2503-C2)-methyltransferase